MNLPVAGLLLVAFCCSPIATIDTSHITDSLSLANDLGGFIESQDFSKTASKLISSVSPYLGVIGSVLSFAFSFLPSGPSAELLAIQKLYKDVTLRFDKIDHQFSAITREIKWGSIEAHFGDYESTIHTISQTYQQLVASRSKTEFNSRKYLFTQAFRSYQKAGEKIYDGIVGQSNLFNGPIFDEAVDHVKWDRKKAQEFMLGVTKLLINAAGIEVAYYHLTNHHDSAKFIQHDWQVKLETIKSKMNAIDHKLTTQYGHQLSTDVDIDIANHNSLSNCDLAHEVYTTIAKKYYWRSWIVTVTDHSTDNHKFMAHACSGTINQKHSKNVVVSSVDPHKAHLTTTQQHVINSVHTSHTYHIMHGGKRDLQKRLTGHRRNDADVAYNSFPAAARTTCSSVYSSIGVVDKNLHMCSSFAHNRLFTRYDGHYYHVFASG